MSSDSKGFQDNLIKSGLQQPDSSVISFDSARERLRARPGFAPTHEELEAELSEAQVLLDKGLSSVAESKLQQVIRYSRQELNILAKARCSLSVALGMQGKIHEAFDAVHFYEQSEARDGLDENVAMEVRTQLANAYNAAGDYPKSIAVLNAALKDASESKSDAQLGMVYLAFAYTYRRINEYQIARDYAQKALAHNRLTGDWRSLATTYRALGLTDTYESKYESALENYQQALQLIGDRNAAYLLGQIYADVAGIHWFLKRPLEGIAYLEKSISYFERTEHKDNAANCYNNLGINLTIIGKWERAQESLETALMMALGVDENDKQVSMILDSIADLHLLRGEYEEAFFNIEKAVELAHKTNRPWFVIQTLRTKARYFISQEKYFEAIEAAKESLELAEKIENQQAVFNARLVLAEAYLRNGNLHWCAQDIRKVNTNTSESTFDFDVTGESQRLQGLLALEMKNYTLAAHHLSRSVSIFETIGDVYRTARARYELGIALAETQTERAAENFSLARKSFRELGAFPALAAAEKALASLDQSRPEQKQEASAFAQLLTLRIAEASASRDLLLAEFASVLHQEMRARLVIISESDDEQHEKIIVAHGGTTDDVFSLVKKLEKLQTEKERERFASDNNISITTLRAPNSKPATLIVSPRNFSSPSGISLQPLLRVVELGLDVCALREKERSTQSSKEQTRPEDQSLLPGFIHSSPAMMQLVEEVHKIRSSDVTVLVTGESGTGKELVSRAIHAISSRRDKIFVPFNCTAVPKELSEAYLFGYRKGAFTSATHDSPGVIRTAAGGTLFLDEIGDLPIDVQPKILRFLQEGEIQPLGEQRPTKVDVRIIAATNTNLEEMVASGRFREDLFYRLNVIRLLVPPLRERRSEISTMVNYYINHYSAKFQKKDVTITPPTVDLLMVCDWPGNVRQLCNEIQRIIARAEDGTVITPDHLSPELRRVSTPHAPQGASITPINSVSVTIGGITLAEAVDELERKMISDAMSRHRGNISAVSRELGLTRRGLYLKLERLQLRASA
jgi:transcriptional regulator with PAS, ATPase and Fis domain